MTMYYLKYETFDNDSIAYELTGDEERSGEILDSVDIPFYKIETIVSRDKVMDCKENVYYGARGWTARIQATEEQYTQIAQLGGPFITWLTEKEYYDLDDEEKRRRTIASEFLKKLQ